MAREVRRCAGRCAGAQGRGQAGAQVRKAGAQVRTSGGRPQFVRLRRGARRETQRTVPARHGQASRKAKTAVAFVSLASLGYPTRAAPKVIARKEAGTLCRGGRREGMEGVFFFFLRRKGVSPPTAQGSPHMKGLLTDCSLLT